MRTARLIPPVLAAATLLLMGANALPSVQRKRLLLDQRRHLVERIRAEQARTARLREEIEALRNDPFYLERLYLETWREGPCGATPFFEFSPEAGDPTLD